VAQEELSLFAHARSFKHQSGAIMRYFFVGLLTLSVLCACGKQSTSTTPAAGAEAASANTLANSLEITSAQQFEQALITHKNKTTIVDFHAEWCGPCKLLAPELAAVASEYPEQVVVLKVNVDVLPALAQRYECEYLPLLVHLKDGKEIARKTGFQSRAQLKQWLELK
jgi:thioredoxin 1